MASLSPPDADVWRAIGARLAPNVESRLGPEVLADRSTKLPIREAVHRARREARRLGLRSRLILRTDIRSFYGSVTPRVAFESVLAQGAERTLAARLARMLDAWESEGYAGLPIGPPASAVVANATLVRVDQRLRPARFLRWVDDFLISIPRDRDVEPTIERLDTALAEVGLERSSAKTAILEGGQPLRWLGTSERG